jgi:hypothetical protein
MNYDLDLNEEGYFREIHGEFAGHGFGSMVLFENPTEEFRKWVLFRDEETNRVDIIDPDLYELFLEKGNDEDFE